MFFNYFITSWRSLLKNKVFSIINILGLAIGMAAFLLISVYVRHEFSYDQFHVNKDNIYRLKQNRYNNGELTTQWAAGCAAVGPALKETYPEVEEFVKMTSSNAMISLGEKVFKEEFTYYTTNSFFRVFSIPMIKGDSNALKSPYNAVMSEATAKKYFGDEDPIGKTIRHNGARDFVIQGVYKDIPENSHLKADILYSFETFVDLAGEGARTEWDWDGFYTYLLLAKGTDRTAFENKIGVVVERDMGEQLKANNNGLDFKLQSLSEIHLSSNYMMEFKPNGDGEATYFLLVVAIFIIVIAWVNYINLATARSMDRSREVGIRKVLGGVRGQLIWQFLTESFLLNLFALATAIVMLVIVLPGFNQLSGRTLLISFYDPILITTFFSLLVVGTLFAGLYPSFILSGFKPVTILKGNGSKSVKSGWLRQGLVVFQFIASLVLMIGTYTVYNQLNFMKNQDLGIDINQTLVIKGPGIVDSLYNDNLNTFKQSLNAFADVNYVAASTAVPGRQPDWNAGGIRLVGENEAAGNQYRVIGMDADYINAFELDIVAGRSFDADITNEDSYVIFNESAVDLIGFDQLEDAINKEIYFWGDTFKIAGVVKNYHQESLKKTFEPLIFRYIPNARNFYAVKVSTNDIQATINNVKEEWKAYFPGNPFNFFFLDEHFDQQYKAEMQFGKVFGLFASLAIFIACLGLFGLTSFITLKRTKEISIRKVLGATVLNVVGLLSKDFTQLIIVAILFAVPISWLIMDDWLGNFAYKMQMSWWIFALPGLVLFAIALLTVLIQTSKAALSNPVDSLRNE